MIIHVQNSSNSNDFELTRFPESLNSLEQRLFHPRGNTSRRNETKCAWSLLISLKNISSQKYAESQQFQFLWTYAPSRSIIRNGPVITLKRVDAGRLYDILRGKKPAFCFLLTLGNNFLWNVDRAVSLYLIGWWQIFRIKDIKKITYNEKFLCIEERIYLHRIFKIIFSIYHSLVENFPRKR